MEVLLITQARLGSSRFPNKILKEINSKSLLEIHLNRLKKSKRVSNFLVASTFEDGIDSVKRISELNGFAFFQGSTKNVLDRFYQSSKKYDSDYIVRVTSDCPLIDAELIDQVINFTINNNLDYGSNILEETFPDGQDIEVFKKEVLNQTWKQAKSFHELEHVTPFIRNNSTYLGQNKFTSENFQSKEDFNHIRMTVDELADFEAIKTLVNQLGIDKDWKTYKNFIKQNPSLFKNQGIIRNEGSLIKKS
ncbi:hypothetical protein OAT74_03270 [Flavobacteriaceae bacterium]|nr:hypothetical protein [Flavobacteriaceae bacterium]